MILLLYYDSFEKSMDESIIFFPVIRLSGFIYYKSEMMIFYFLSTYFLQFKLSLIE